VFPLEKLWSKYSYTIILFILLSFALLLIKVNLPDSAEEYITITVMEGDSLWEISQKYKDQHRFSENDFIAWVKNQNGLTDDTIYSGDQLMIPIIEKQFEPDSFRNLASQ